MTALRYLTATAIILAASAVNAEVYRWVDAQGNVQFGDQPVAAEQAKKVEVPKFKGPDPEYLERLEKQKRFSDARAADRDKAMEEKKKQQEIDKQYADACTKAKERLSLLDGGTPLYIQGEGEERHYLSDEERVKHRQTTQKQIAEYCKK